MIVKHAGDHPQPLDPADSGGTYKFVGGRLSFDFVNTISFRSSDAPHDWFDPPVNVIAWALAANLIDPKVGRRLEKRTRSPDRKVRRALGRLRRHRTTIYAALSPLGQGTPPPPAAVEALNRLLTGASGHRRLDPTALTWIWDPVERLDQITWPVVFDAAQVLTDSDPARIGQCPACDWLFYDTTRNRSRRWCDMGDCGSRNKSLRYYHRRRRTGPTPRRIPLK